MRIARTLATTAAAAVLAACGTGTSPTPTVDGTLDATSPSPTATATPAGTPSPTPTEEPTPTPTPESAFDDPQECENPELGYEVEYPGGWWANERVDAEEPVTDITACTYFAPEAVELEPGTDDLTGVAVRFDVVDRDVEPGGEILAEDEVTVDGRDARVIEFEPEPQPGFIEEGERIYRYEVSLPGGGWLFATTDTINQDDARYEESKPVLDAMMETIELED